MDTNHDQRGTSTGDQRPRSEVLADAIRVLTEAARLRRRVMRRDENGAWSADPTETEPGDWAEFVTHALAGAAANVGGVDTALAGRPGSWEADGVRNLLYSTVGYDEQYLFEHRTEPLRIVVDVEAILSEFGIDWLYDDSEAAIAEMADAATAHFDYSPYEWAYTRDAGGQYVATDPEAPSWSVERWRAALVDEQVDADTINYLEEVLVGGKALYATIWKSPEAARAAAQLAAQEDAIRSEFQARLDELDAQRSREWAEYAEAFTANVRREAVRVYPGMPIQIDVNLSAADASAADDLANDGLPQTLLLEYALLHTPLPGSGIAPKDYPRASSIREAEMAAGRLPHLRMPAMRQREGGDHS